MAGDRAVLAGQRRAELWHGQMLLLGGPFTMYRPYVIGRCAT